VWRRPIRFGLGLRLFLGFLLVLGLGDLVTAGLVDRNVAASAHAQVEERLRYEVIMLGQMTANALFGPIDPSDTSLAGVVSQLADAVHTNLSVLAVDGTVVADSDAADLKSQENQARAPEVVSALDGGTGVSVRVAGGAPRMFVAQLIARDGKPLGIARASVPMGVVDAVALAARLQMAYGGLAAAVIAMIIAGFIALGIIRPVRKLADGARKIGAGELDHRIDVRSRDEIGDLGRALNEMVGRLQSMVGALDQRNRDLRVVLDNVEQGLVTVDAEGRIADERSKAIDSWFGTPPHGTLLWDMFDEAGAPAQVKASLALGWDQLFGGMLPHELSLAQLPRRIRAGERYFELGCEPIFRDGDTLDKALVVVSDVTAVVAAELSDVEQREQLALFGAVAKDREGVADFFRSTGEIVDYVAANGTRIDLATDVKRGLHTIKGNSGLFGLTSLATLCHDIETRVAEGELVGAEETVTKDDCEALARAWASLVARGHDLLGNLPSSAIDVSQQDIAALVVAIQRGARSDALIRTIATWSLDPAEKRLSRLALQAQQLAARMGKAGVTVEVEPSTVRLPTDRWAPFWGSLAHVVRNALDHGIEAAEERASAGKPGNGRLKLSARESADEVVVEIADDGRGIQWARVREKARAAGLLATTDADLVHALFADGVSTAELATEYSGRGVGMSAVRAACESLGGQVDVVSVLGVGTTMRFRFPRPGMGDSLTKLAGVVSVPPPPRSVSVPRMVASVDA
jgi:two-component system chemotaxis sensor kinase CheA